MSGVSGKDSIILITVATVSDDINKLSFLQSLLLNILDLSILHNSNIKQEKALVKAA